MIWQLWSIDSVNSLYTDGIYELNPNYTPISMFTKSTGGKLYWD